MSPGQEHRDPGETGCAGNSHDSEASLNRSQRRELPVALTIAGSDSGGGAGIQADLKTFSALDVFGTCAITCVTAQNPERVTGVEPLSAGMVVSQVDAVCEGFPVAAAKTGMLYSSEIIRGVASVVKKQRLPYLVVDPVMLATSGAGLLKNEAVEALESELLPLASVMTPNIPEAEVLCGRHIGSAADLSEAAETLALKYGVACIVKGGHLSAESGGYGPENEVVDVLFMNGHATVLRAGRIAARETHGTGCTFSAALTAFLASGKNMNDAFAAAKNFVGQALDRAFRAGQHYPLGIRAYVPDR